MLRAHFYVISFAKSDLSIISTTFNAVEGILRDQDYQAYFAYMKLGLKLTWIWLTFSAVLISTFRKVVQSHNNVLHRPKTKEEDYM